MSKEKILTMVDDNVEFVTKKKDLNNSLTYCEYVMKTSKSDCWSDSKKNTVLISALDTGNDLDITFKSRDADDCIQESTLCLDYAQAFELYCFLDLWHKEDPYFTGIKHSKRMKRKK